MDTKSKKSEYHPLVKLVAVLLTIIFAFFTGINALNFIRKGVYYASEDGEFKNTPIFTTEMKRTLWDNMSNFKEVADFYEVYISYGDYLKTDNAKKIIKEYNEKEERAIKLFNTIQELKKLRPDTIETKNGSYEIDDNGIVFFPENDEYIECYEFYEYYNDYYYDDDEYSEQATSVVIYNYDIDDIDYPSDDKVLFSIKDEYTSFSDWNNKYLQLRGAIFDIVDNATSIDSIKSELEDDKEYALDMSYYNNVELTTAKLNRLINVKFILTNNKNGQTISNVPVDERKAFVENLKNDQLYYIEFDGEKLLSPENKINYSTNLLKFLTDSYLLPDEAINEKFMLEHFKGFSLYLKLNEGLVAGDNFYAMHNSFSQVNGTNESTYLAFTVLFALLSITCFVVCCKISGKQKDGSIKLTKTDRIPFVIYLAFTVALIGASGCGVGYMAYIDFIEPKEIYEQFEALQWLFTPSLIRNAIGIGFALISLFLLSFVLYIVRNVKAGTFTNRFILIFLIRKIGCGIRKIKGAIRKAKEKAKLKAAEKELTPDQIKRKIKRQTIIPVAVFMGMNLFLYIVSFTPAVPVAVIALIIFNCLAVVYAILYLSDILRLMKIAEEIRNGNYRQKINPKTFVTPLKKFAIDLEACRDGIENAINEAIKGEHLKTELITNVSHDLKTPLTSIINYVSLLKMDNATEEDKAKYIDILDEKSKKLKRLIEDLTEASKANSGNIKMNVAQVNLNEMALQAVGENSDVLENAGLDVILTEKDKEIIVSADSQRTFRIIDNLFSNAKKYSLAGTRVYVDVYKETGYGVFEIKNISREKLNIDPDELTERFVRGDNSRTTDGSGLGLSIARSFAELQNGAFNIEIDGDMFKAIVKLPLI